MLNATQLKNNTCFLYQNQPYKVLQYKHTHLGRGGAKIRVRVKNLKTGNVLNLHFNSNDRFEEVVLEKKKMQYLYQQGDEYVFMEPETFEQISLGIQLLGQGAKFLKEGEEVNIMFWQDQPLDVDLPVSVVVEIADCDPGVKGNSATNIFKAAMTKEGLKIKVPLFVDKGDKVKIDTRTGEYVERAK